MYKLCSSVDGSIESTAENKRRNIDDWGKNCGWYFEGYRRRTNTISKVDGDMSTGGAWSEIDLGVWTRDLNAGPMLRRHEEPVKRMEHPRRDEQKRV